MSQPAQPEGLSMLEKRTIEADILKEVYVTLKASHGEEVAKKTIAESVRRSAIEQARQFAAAAPGGTSLKAFQDVMPLWTKGGLPMTQNPMWLEPTATGLRGYFIPEDDVSTLYMYDVEVR